MSKRLTPELVRQERSALENAVYTARNRWRNDTLEQEYILIVQQAVDNLLACVEQLTERVAELESRTTEPPDA